MDRIKEGYVDVNGFVIGPETTSQELMDLSIDKAVQRIHSRGYLEILFNAPIISDGVEFQVSVRIANKDDKKYIFLDPKLKLPAESTQNVLEKSRHKQEICEDWLKRNMGVEPTRDTDEGIFYEFPWGVLYCSAAAHVNLGTTEGGMLITYGDA